MLRDATVLNARKFDRDLEEESFQSLPVGEEFYGGAGSTRDAANAPSSRNTNIVINEIMFDAPSDQRGQEYIELFNRGASSVDLDGWRFTSGIGFDFPPGTSIAPGGFLVIAADAATLNSSYAGLAAIGDWSGTLRDRGELLRLEDSNGNLADEVDYLPEGDWPNMADGDGASMELRHPDMNNNVATAWADSDESNKSEFRSFVYTADFENASWQGLNAITGAQELHAHLVGDSHIIIKNVSLRRNNTGANLISNAATMSPDQLSSKGWVTQGTHWQSFFQGDELNLVSTGHGDNKANRGEVDISALSIGQSYTLSFDARWVSGKSRIIFQTLDHGFGTSFVIPVPANLGTPGAANSALLASAAPTVAEIIHQPAVPSTTNPVKVTARIDSSAALSSVELVHRLDDNTGNAPWLRTAMTDEGDGLYAATITQYQQQGDIVQFYVEAKSGASSTFQPRFGPERPAMWIVDSREMPDVFLRERFVVSEFDRRALTTSIGFGPNFGYNFPRMSNQFFNATFIANESEIYYNAEIRKSGSPFTRSTNSNIDHGKWKLPGDRLFRDRRRSVIDASGTPQGSGTPRFYDDRIARYFLYQLGHPVNEMEFVHSVVNTLDFRLRENQEPISNDFLNRHFVDGTDGTLLRVDDEWRFNSDTNPDSNSTRNSRNADWSYKNSDNPTRYQSEWIMRTRENDHDFSTFIEWVRTLDEDNFTEESIGRIANIDMLCLNAAVRGYDADWDTLTVNRGKNAYFYRPKESGNYGGGWMLLHWDGDRVFERGNQAILGTRVGVKTFFEKPFIKRRMNYYMTKLLDEHTRGSARTQAWIDAEKAAVAGTGIATGTDGANTNVNNQMAVYINWFASREALARNFVGTTETNTDFNITTSNASTSADSIDLSGTAPPEIFTLRVADQPGLTFTWLDTTSWTLDGVQLQQGVNSITVEGIDHDGNIVDQRQFNITKIGNTAPVIAIATSPNSRNVGLSEILTLDASGSIDPEGGVLNFTWQVTPTSGVNLIPAADTATATFSQSGLYTFTATATDDQSQSTNLAVSVAVYGPESFSTFGNNELEDFLSLSNIEQHNNSPDSPYYSLQDNEGRLTINIPFASSSQGVPAWIHRPLPATSDWSLDTEVKLEKSQFGEFLAGLLIQSSAGTYSLGFDGGDTISAIQTPNGGSANNLASAPALGSDNIRVRIQRTGNQLTFFWGDELGLTQLQQVTLPAGTTFSRGGVFASASSAAQSVEASFDFLMLIDSTPASTATLIVSEIMYHPAAGGSSLEFIELYNTGSSAITLTSFSSIATEPFDEYTFPAFTLQPGAYGLLVADEASFLDQYGAGLAPQIIGQWAGGGLSNGGETITFADAAGALITSFAYDDKTPWAESPDGDGPSLVIIDPDGDLDPSLPTSWRASFFNGGSPGSADTAGPDFANWMTDNGFTNPQAEYANSGLTNLLAYALGRDLANSVIPSVADDGGFASFSYRQRLGDSSLSYAVERSNDLDTWVPATDLTIDGTSNNNDGTQTVKLLSNLPTNDRADTFYRLRVTE